MIRDLMICKRIMLQIAQNGHFVSSTLEEAYHVALLVDRGYVTATIETDDCGTPVKATVGRMTAIGHDALDREYSDGSIAPSPIISKEKYYGILTDLKQKNEFARDKILSTIATGGIGILFGIASYLKTNSKVFQLLPWIITLVLWAWVLIGLLIADHAGGKAMDKAIAQLAEDNSDIMQSNTLWDRVSSIFNFLNCLAAIVGIGAFAWFLLTIV